MLLSFFSLYEVIKDNYYNLLTIVGYHKLKNKLQIPFLVLTEGNFFLNKMILFLNSHILYFFIRMIIKNLGISVKCSPRQSEWFINIFWTFRNILVNSTKQQQFGNCFCSVPLGFSTSSPSCSSRLQSSISSFFYQLPFLLSKRSH